LILAPSPERLPDSSLSSMLGLIARVYAGSVTYAWNTAGLDLDAAFTWLGRAEAAAAPVQILSTSFALVHLLDEAARRGLSWSLVPGTALMTTGGFKGRSRTLDPGRLDALARESLGDLRHVVEYGMTELGSQFWGEFGGPLLGPRWCRVTVHEPQSLGAVPEGEVGLLRFTDLANVDSVVSVQTSDWGRLVARGAAGDTIELVGRAPGARPRGCSLLVDELVGAGEPAGE
jgi:hypothetical protein